MTWADRTIKDLQAGKISECRPRGNSMRGRIENGQLVTLAPNITPQVGDAVLCRVKGKVYIHLVKATQGHGDSIRYLIGNNRGGVNGWTATIYGVVTKVED